VALVCSTDLTGVDLGFTEFIDCSTINISYNETGVATVSFAVVASAAEPVDVNAYTSLTYGGVHFTGYITGLAIKRMPGTLAYEHRYTLSMIGCRV
jgi:hypothetical protein